MAEKKKASKERCPCTRPSITIEPWSVRRADGVMFTPCPEPVAVIPGITTVVEGGLCGAATRRQVPGAAAEPVHTDMLVHVGISNGSHSHPDSGCNFLYSSKRKNSRPSNIEKNWNEI